MPLNIGCCSRAQEIQGGHCRGVFQNAVRIWTQRSGSFDHPDRPEYLGSGSDRDCVPGALTRARVERVANSSVSTVDLPVLLCVLREIRDVTRQDALLPDVVDLLVWEARIGDNVLCRVFDRDRAPAAAAIALASENMSPPAGAGSFPSSVTPRAVVSSASSRCQGSSSATTSTAIFDASDAPMSGS